MWSDNHTESQEIFYSVTMSKKVYRLFSSSMRFIRLTKFLTSGRQSFRYIKALSTGRCLSMGLFKKDGAQKEYSLIDVSRAFSSSDV